MIVKDDVPLFLDNFTLLRIARSIQADDLGEGVLADLRAMSCFLVLSERADLLDKMIQTLDADILVKNFKGKIADCRFWQGERKRRLQQTLDEAVAVRDKLWTDYEIYRRFIAYENKSLIVIKS